MFSLSYVLCKKMGAGGGRAIPLLQPEGDSNLASFMGELSCRPSLYTVYGTAKQMHAGGNTTSLAKHQHESQTKGESTTADNNSNGVSWLSVMPKKQPQIDKVHQQQRMMIRRCSWAKPFLKRCWHHQLPLGIILQTYTVLLVYALLHFILLSTLTEHFHPTQKHLTWSSLLILIQLNSQSTTWYQTIILFIM